MNICVFLYRAAYYIGDLRVSWMVCKRCQQRLTSGKQPGPCGRKPKPRIDVRQL